MNIELPARPDMIAPPAPAPKKKRHIGLIVLAVLGGLLVLGYVGDVTEKATTTTTTVPVIDDELLSYDGSTVSEMVVAFDGSGSTEILCDSIDLVGYSEARQIFLDADPQLGSDEYEGAVFDETTYGC